MKLVHAVKERSYFVGFGMGAGKMILAVLSRSWLLFIHAVYSVIKASAMYFALGEHEGRCNTMFYSGLLIMAASAVYLVYSIWIYFFGSSASYHMVISIGIAAVTTYELIAAIYGLKRAKKKKDVKLETVKYINLASALVSVSLTQTAILSFAGKGDMSKAYAIGDAVFGFLALLVGAAMLFRAGRLEKKQACQ